MAAEEFDRAKNVEDFKVKVSGVISTLSEAIELGISPLEIGNKAKIKDLVIKELDNTITQMRESSDPVESNISLLEELIETVRSDENKAVEIFTDAKDEYTEQVRKLQNSFVDILSDIYSASYYDRRVDLTNLKVEIFSPSTFRKYYRKTNPTSDESSWTVGAVIEQYNINGARTIIIQADIKFIPQREDRGVKLQLNAGYALDHELIHYSVRQRKEKYVDSNGKDGFKLYSGFNVFLFKEDGTELRWKSQESIDNGLRVLDEGFVTYLDNRLRMYRNSDGVVYDHRIKNQLEIDFTISKYDKESAIAISEMVLRVGLEPFTKAYFESNPILLFDSIKRMLGQVELDRFIQKMKSIQKSIDDRPVQGY